MTSPITVFRFRVDFIDATAGSAQAGSPQPVCQGQFSECSGLEATMEPFAIKEGGNNFGEIQRAGRTTFGTVVLKRGMTNNRHLWKWFNAVTGGGYAYRLNAIVTMLGADAPHDDPSGVVQWELLNALPTKFKAADLDSKRSEIGIEELHFVHQGLRHVAG